MSWLWLIVNVVLTGVLIWGAFVLVTWGLYLIFEGAARSFTGEESGKDRED